MVRDVHLPRAGRLSHLHALAQLWHHGQTGLNLAVWRAYDPEIGRWINRDPIGMAGGINVYEYSSSSPLNMIDPIGLYDYGWIDNALLEPEDMSIKNLGTGAGVVASYAALSAGYYAAESALVAAALKLMGKQKCVKVDGAAKGFKRPGTGKCLSNKDI